MNVLHHRSVPVSTGLGMMWPGGRKHRAGRSAGHLNGGGETQQRARGANDAGLEPGLAWHRRGAVKGHGPRRLQQNGRDVVVENRPSRRRGVWATTLRGNTEW